MCHRGPTSYQGATTPLAAPRWLVGPLWAFWYSPEASWVSFLPEKIIKKIRGNWTSFGNVNLKSKKHAEISNWHWALGQ